MNTIEKKMQNTHNVQYNDEFFMCKYADNSLFKEKNF